jgi:YHS domain-containing protein
VIEASKGEVTMMLLWVVVIGLAFYLLMRGGGCCGGHAGQEQHGAPMTMASTTEGAPTKDPVCGMDIQADKAPFSEEYKGKTYRFCSDSCHDRFLKNPGQYAGKSI